MQYLCGLLWPFLESYWISSVFLFSLKPKDTPLSLNQFLQQVQWFAESMYEERIIEFYESCSQETIKNAINSFQVTLIIKYISTHAYAWSYHMIGNFPPKRDH